MKKSTQKKFEFLFIFAISAIFVNVILPFDVFAQIADLTETIRQVGEETKLPGFEAGHSKHSYQPGASQITSVIYFILDFIKYVFGSIAVLVLIIAGIKLVIAGRKADESLKAEKETIRYTATALFMILMADQVVRLVFFGEEGEIYRSSADLQEAAKRGNALLSGFTNLIRVFIPSLAVLFLIFAGVRMISSGTDAEQSNKAKKQILWAVMGLILAGLVEVIVFNIVYPDSGERLSDPYALNKLVITMTNFLSGFISIIAVTMLIYAGYLYVISQGGQNAEKAKKAIFAAVIGLLIAMGAYALVHSFIKLENPTQIDASESVQKTININQ